ncbi:MAG: Rieske 2Fe-2S domain-containing protein [Marinagarivorans sp.]|nr:Rieske 2Fe-2S domain-containing protein [Marinagarivorans sp.]
MFLCHLNDLKNAITLGVSANNTQYLLVYIEDKVKAYINSCPHLSIPLEWQKHDFLEPDSGLIRCSTHGALFLPSTGECVSGPCVGDALTPVAISITDGSISLA